MKRITGMIKRIASVTFLLIQVFSAASQENPLQLGGEIYIDNRFRLANGDWSWNENRLDLELDKKFADKAKFHSDIWLRSFGFPFLNQSEQLFNPDQTSPYNLQIREAYVEFYGIFSKNLDIKIGRQRIAWGTADKLNPTDNLNAYDLEDIWDFGRHHGSDAIQAKYYFGDFYVEGDYILFFRPATLPRGDWASGLYALPTDLPIISYVSEMSDSLVLPELNLKDSPTYGLKFGGFAGGFDFSASYVYGRYDLPVPYLTVLSVDSTPGVKVRNYMNYPRIHIVGLDIAGSIGDIGVWAEAAAFIPPEELDLSAIIFGMPVKDSVLVEKGPYFKVVAGLDYTFKGGHYINFQYLHGFVHERGKGNLNDYFVLNYEKKFFNDKLKIQPATIALVVSDWKDVANEYALVYMPFITYMPNDNAEIAIGVRLIGGEGDDIFAQYKDKDEFVFSVRYKF